MAITLTPVHNGRLEILLNEDFLFDKKAQGNTYPGLDTIRKLKTQIEQRLQQ